MTSPPKRNMPGYSIVSIPNIRCLPGRSRRAETISRTPSPRLSSVSQLKDPSSNKLRPSVPRPDVPCSQKTRPRESAIPTSHRPGDWGRCCAKASVRFQFSEQREILLTALRGISFCSIGRGTIGDADQHSERQLYNEQSCPRVRWI